MFRGSKSSEASAYKKAGHVNEDHFGDIVGGTNKGLPPQGKTDWKDDSGKTFSIKQGLDLVSRKWTKHWQIFLYGLPRLKSDQGFLKLGATGEQLVKLLESFPDDPKAYFADKEVVKVALSALPKSVRGSSRTESVTLSVGTQNHYVSSKLRLADATGNLASSLKNRQNLANFLRKSMFNDDEVEFLSVRFKDKFLIFPREAVIDTFCDALTVDVSKAGAISTDLNIAGQKVIMKTGVNVIELEVRNEPNHYRELRFNMNARKAIEILLANMEMEFDTHDGRIQWFKAKVLKE